MGFTNFPGGVTSMGIPVLGGGGIPATPGNVIFVDYGNGDDGRSVKSNTAQRAFKTLDKAYSLAATNKDDIIVLVGNTTHTLTEMLSVTKNRVHFVGIDGTSGRYYGQNAKISLGITAAATDIGTILNIGVRNSFHNIKVVNSNTVAQGLYSFVEGGEYTVIDRCEIYKDTLLNGTTASELVMNGDSAQVVNCTIGSSANACVGDVIRANVRITKGLAGTGKVARDVVFENCRFLKKASHANNRFFYAANATDVERMFHIQNCMFYTAKLSSATPAQCVAAAAQQTEGDILMDNCVSIGNTKLSTTTGVYINGVVPTYATSGISVAA